MPFDPPLPGNKAVMIVYGDNKTADDAYAVALARADGNPLRAVIRIADASAVLTADERMVYKPIDVRDAAVANGKVCDTLSNGQALVSLYVERAFNRAEKELAGNS